MLTLVQAFFYYALIMNHSHGIWILLGYDFLFLFKGNLIGYDYQSHKFLFFMTSFFLYKLFFYGQWKDLAKQLQSIGFYIIISAIVYGILFQDNPARFYTVNYSLWVFLFYIPFLILIYLSNYLNPIITYMTKVSDPKSLLLVGVKFAIIATIMMLYAASYKFIYEALIQQSGFKFLDHFLFRIGVIGFPYVTNNLIYFMLSGLLLGILTEGQLNKNLIGIKEPYNSYLRNTFKPVFYLHALYLVAIERYITGLITTYDFVNGVVVSLGFLGIVYGVHRFITQPK